MQRVCTILIATIVGLSANSTIQAQWLNRYPRSNTYWVNLGPGFNLFGASLGAGGSYQFEDRIFTVRWTHSQEIPRWGDGTSPVRYLQDLSFLYGLEFGAYGWDFNSVAIGLAYVRGRNRGRYLYSTFDGIGVTTWHEAVSVSTIGVSFEAQAFWRPHPLLGTGITIYGHATKANIVAGVLLSLQLGKLEHL